MNAFDFGFSADIAEADNVFFPFRYLTQGAGNAVFVDEDVPAQSSFMQFGKIFAGRKQHIDFRQGAGYGFAPFVFGIPLLAEDFIFVKHELVRTNPPCVMQGNKCFDTGFPTNIDHADAHALNAVDMGDVGLYEFDDVFDDFIKTRVFVGGCIF